MSKVKLYSVSGSPPTLAVKMLMLTIDLPHEVISVNFGAGEHLTPEFSKINPQNELPCLDDNGFLLSESVAMLQYIADKYCKTDELYPKDPRKRAVINHRLMFNTTTYYKSISDYVVFPIFYSYLYKCNDNDLYKMNRALSLFNTYLERSGTKYAADNVVTIADFPLIMGTMCLEAVDFPMKNFTQVTRWYSVFKKEKPELWSIANEAMDELRAFYKNPPDLSGLNHPLHPPPKK